MDKTIIQVEKKSVFGRELIYPICNIAKTLCELLNVKTLNDFQIRKLESLDYYLTYNGGDYWYCSYNQTTR